MPDWLLTKTIFLGQLYASNYTRNKLKIFTLADISIVENDNAIAIKKRDLIAHLR